jgi:hypothetical protein
VFGLEHGVLYHEKPWSATLIALRIRARTPTKIEFEGGAEGSRNTATTSHGQPAWSRDHARQTRRAQATDMTLNPTGMLSASWLTDEWRDSVRAQLAALRGALDREEWALAIGYAKNLVEAAALVELQRAGKDPPAGRSSVSTLVREACDAADKPDDLAKRSASVVQAVADLRNETDAGHGQAVRAEVLPVEARLAASSAVAAFLLAAD